MRPREFHSRPNREDKKERFDMLCSVCGNEARFFGSNRSGSFRYRCDECRRTWTDATTQGTDRRRVSRDKMLLILDLLLEGISIRALERKFGVHRDTIIGHMVDAGEKCERFLREKIVGMAVDQVQIDEVWAFCGMKEKTRVQLDRAECFGDIWMFTAIERSTKLVLTWHVGKRTPADTRRFTDHLRRATSGKFQMTSDGWRPYLTAVPASFADRGIDYASLKKVYGLAPEDRGYSPGKVIDIIETVHMGNPDEDMICTSHVERHNKTLRMHIRRLTRLTDAHSKKWENHEAAMAFFIAYYNFCRVHMTLKKTPAQASGLTSETWSLEKLLAEAAK
jgi:IS1 family transposase/transposase-like protein